MYGDTRLEKSKRFSNRNQKRKNEENAVNLEVKVEVKINCLWV